MRRRTHRLHWACLGIACLGMAVLAAADVDSDGDGLSDFHERHKYFTDPAAADTDGDGFSDGDWSERREYAYTVRVLVHVLPPVTVDVLCDDYQDARILDRTDDYIELEVVLYPLNTVAEALEADPAWRTTAADMPAWTAPGPTANWDAELRKQIIGLLASNGVDAAVLDDLDLVRAASKHLLQHAQYVDGFTTFCSTFVDGEARVFPGMEEAAQRGQVEKSLSLQAQWQRELFAKGMFENARRGSCTSSAIYLNGCLRALGIPTRIVLAIPLIDSSDEREHELVRRLRHHRVRRAVQQGSGEISASWRSHTFNEVFVGRRWRRLNYDNLGQNILDPNLFGMTIHVATFSDWADGNMAATWGMRQAQPDRTHDPFGGSNPYSTIAISDRFGEHASIENPPPEEHRVLTIDAAYWMGACPVDVQMRLDDPESAGHVVVRVEEGRPNEGPGQYQQFYDGVGKDFLLRAAGEPDVPLHAARGYWAAPERGLQHFYLRIEPADFARMTAGVPFALHAVDQAGEYRWAVLPDVTLTKPANAAARTPSSGTPAPSGDPPALGERPAYRAEPTEVLLDWACWSDSPDSPAGPLPIPKPVILARAGTQTEFDAIKNFTRRADLRFFLVADGRPTLKVGAKVGGVTTGEHAFIVIELGPADWDGLVEGETYELRPQNATDGLSWVCPRPLHVRR